MRVDFIFQIRDELEQLLDDDDDMADLYLSRKLASSSPVSSAGAPPNWFLSSPTIGSKISRTSRASATTMQGEHDVEELEMLLEVVTCNMLFMCCIDLSNSLRSLTWISWQAYFIQIDGTLNKLSTVCALPHLQMNF